MAPKLRGSKEEAPLYIFLLTKQYKIRQGGSKCAPRLIPRGTIRYSAIAIVTLK